MKLFRINEDYEIVPEKDTLYLIPEFNALFSLNYNKQSGDNQGRKRMRAKYELIFIYFAYDYRSEYSDLDEEERISEARKAAGFDENYKISKELQTAIDKFIYLQDSKELRLLKTARDTVDKIRNYLEDTEISSNNIKDVVSTLSGLGKLLISLGQLETSVKKAMQQGNRTRGDQIPGRL